MLTIGSKNGAVVASIEDRGGDEFDIGVTLSGRLVVSWKDDVANMMLDRKAAGQFGRLLLGFERTGDLSEAAGAIEGPAAEDQQDIRDKVDDLDGTVQRHERLLAEAFSRLVEVAKRAGAAEARIHILDVSRAERAIEAVDNRSRIRDSIGGLELRMDAVEEAIRACPKAASAATDERGLPTVMDRLAGLDAAVARLASFSVQDAAQISILTTKAERIQDLFSAPKAN